MFININEYKVYFIQRLCNVEIGAYSCLCFEFLIMLFHSMYFDDYLK